MCYSILALVDNSHNIYMVKQLLIVLIFCEGSVEATL